MRPVVFAPLFWPGLLTGSIIEFYVLLFVVILLASAEVVSVIGYFYWSLGDILSTY